MHLVNNAPFNVLWPLPDSFWGEQRVSRISISHRLGDLYKSHLFPAPSNVTLATRVRAPAPSLTAGAFHGVPVRRERARNP